MIYCYQGVTLNGKRFDFRQNKYILRTSISKGGMQMENRTKGYIGVRCSCRSYQHCRDGYQYYRYGNEYGTDR